jgi:2-methylcitrate synthase
MASFGSMLLYWYHYSHNGKRIEVETDDDSIGGHFLHLLHGEKPAGIVVRAMHLADPVRRTRFNASTFTSRDRRHRFRHVLGDHRRDRRAARS